MLDVENYPRPSDPAGIARWELDVMDGTLVPEFREVRVGWKKPPVYEQVEVSYMGRLKKALIDAELIEDGEPIFEEQLVWVRNPDLPKERPPDPGRYGNRKRTASTGPK